MEKKFGAITSSQNPEEISNRIKGVTVAMSALIIFFASQIFHITLTANDVITLGSELGAVGGAIWTLYGAGMAVWSYFFKKASA